MMKRLARGLAVCACVLATGISTAGVNTWTISGPQGGTFFDLERSSTGPWTVYAAYNHSFFRSDDGGRTWSAGYHFRGQAQEIAVDPTDGRRLYIAIVGEGLFRSEDAGQTFTLLVPSFFGIWGVGAAADGQTVYYSDNNNFARSTDRGATWITRSTPPNVVSQMTVDPANRDMIVGKMGFGMARSADGGLTWTETTLENFYVVNALKRVSSSELLIGTGIEVLRSADGGQTWARVTGGPVWSLDVDPHNPDRVIAGREAWGPMLISSDRGQSWSSIGNPTPQRLLRGVLFGPRRTGPSFIAADEEGVQLSFDNGATWSAATRGPAASGATSLVAADTLDSPIYASTFSNGLHITQNGGASWSYQPGPMIGQSSMSVKPDDPRVMLGSNALMRSTDGGLSWTFNDEFSVFNSNLNINVDMTSAFGRRNPNQAIALITFPFFSLQNTSARVFSSLDAGLTWTPMHGDVPLIKIEKLVIDPNDGMRMFAGGGWVGFVLNSGGLYRSIDAGMNWIPAGFAGLNVPDIAVEPGNSNNVWAATAIGLYQSSDGGETFTLNLPFQSITPVSVGSVVIDPEAPATTYVATLPPSSSFNQDQPSLIARSVDRGQSWEVLRDTVARPAYITNRLLLDPARPTRLLAGTGRYGVATFEVQNDLSVAISNHSGKRFQGIPTSYQVRVSNGGNYAATLVDIETGLPSGATAITWNISAGTCRQDGLSLACDLPVLRAGQSVDITVNYTPSQPGVLEVTARVDAHEGDNRPLNNHEVAALFCRASTQ